jgi:hypothetical protein
MPSCHVTFMLPFDDSNKENGYNSDFKNIYKLKEETELDLNKEILLFKDNNLDPDSELEERTSFINIKEYLAEITLIKPLELSLIKIPVLLFNYPTLILKSRALSNNKTKIQALTLL